MSSSVTLNTVSVLRMVVLLMGTGEGDRGETGGGGGGEDMIDAGAS